MWICQATRAEFLSIVQAERQLAAPDDLAVKQTTELTRLRSELMLVWKADPREQPGLPSVIVLPDGSTRDFLSWTSSYLADYRPLTAQVRVFEYQGTGRYFRAEPAHWLGRLQNVCAAMVLAETIAHLEGGRDLDSLPRVVFGNTYSFSRARDLALWGPPTADDRLFERWRAARSLMRQSREPLDPRDLTLPWTIIGRLAAGKAVGDEDDGQQSLVDAAAQVFADGTIRDDLWSRLTSRAGLSDGPDLVRKRSREERVVAWEAIVQQWPEAESAREIHAFICGYLANAIAPGSFEHSSLVLRSAHAPQRTLLWYGLFAGLTPGSSVRDAFNGLGRHLLRDIAAEASVLDHPRTDVALAELELLSVERHGHPGLLTASSGTVHVEIAPCIGTLVRWPGGEFSIPVQDQLFETKEHKTDPTVELALLEIRDNLARVEGAHRKLLRSLGLDPEPRRMPRRGPRT